MLMYVSRKRKTDKRHCHARSMSAMQERMKSHAACEVMLVEIKRESMKCDGR